MGNRDSTFDFIGSQIDFSNLVQRPILQICKPDRKVIGNIVDFKGLQYKLNLGNINELTFSIPVYVDKDNENILNPQLDLIKERYYIKLRVNGLTYWFMIRKSNSIMNDSEEYKEFQCFSIAYELKNKILRAYEVTSHTASQVLTAVLSRTNWSIGYIDADYNLKYRAFNVSQCTVLDFVINEFVETFGCLIIFDEQNRMINLYNPDNYGVNTGFKVGYGKLMKSVDKETDTENLCTVLNVYGKDNLSIQRLNPTGSPYLEDFSFYMYPFLRDENKNVISHSDYMSDSLCHAILDYKELVEDKTGEFNTYTEELKNLQETLNTRYNELSALQTQLIQVMDSLDIVNGKGVVTTEQQQEHAQLVSERNSLENQISAKTGQINTLNNQITAKNNQINMLRNLLKLENNFTSGQIIERNGFIDEKTWENTNYIDDESLYEAALIEFEKIKEPPILVKLDIVSLLDILEEQHNWDKLKLGNWITIKHDRLGINIKAKIIEMDVDYDGYGLSLTISNEKEILNDEERALRDIYRGASTSTTVNMNQDKWNTAQDANFGVAKLVDILTGNVKEDINMSVNQNVDIGRRGIIIRDPDDPMNYLVAQNSVLAITNDDGNTWKHALTANGLVAENIYGKLGVFAKINANQIVVSEDGTETTLTGISKDYVDSRFTNDLRMTSSLPTSITMSSNGIRASTATSNKYAQLDHRGLYINGGALQIDASNGKTNYITGEYIDVGNAGISNAGTLNGDIRLWAGSKYANRNSAPFRVTQAGNLVASNANISGTIHAISGTFNGVVNASDFRINGISVLRNNKIDGDYLTNVKADTVSANWVYAGAVAAGQITAGTITATISMTAPTIIGGNITGAYITGGTITVNELLQTYGFTRTGLGSVSVDSSGQIVLNGWGVSVVGGSLNMNDNSITNVYLPEYATRSWVYDLFDDMDYAYIGSYDGSRYTLEANSIGLAIRRNGNLMGTVEWS